MALSVLNTLLIAAYGRWSNIIHVSGNVYAVATEDAVEDGWIFTINVNADGTMSAIDSLEFETDKCRAPHIVYVSGDIYAIAYTGPDADGWIVTVEIDSSGNITDPVIYRHEYNADKGWSAFIRKISGTTYAIAYSGPGDDGWLKTITIANDGTIAASPDIANLEFDTDDGNSPVMYHISGNIYAIAYRCYVDVTIKNVIRVKTVSISDDGAIGAVIDTLQIPAPGSGLYAYPSRIVHVAGNVYSLIQSANDGVGNKRVYAETFDIDPAGNIGAVIDSVQMDVGGSFAPDMVKLSSNVFLEANEGLGSDGYLRNFAIADDGTIGAVDEWLEFETGNLASTPSLVLRSTTILVIAYNNVVRTIGGVAAIILPTVTTGAATLVGSRTATGNGNITNTGGENCDKRGFVYDTSSHGDPRNIEPAKSEYADYVEETDSFGTGAFTGSLTSLLPETTYYVRAYAHNLAGYSYGDEVSFTTLGAAPTVTTNPATEVGQTTATLNGTLEADGGEACDCYFEYGETAEYGTETATQSKRTGETFSQEVRGLKGGTVYHFRAVATNSAGTSHGDDQTFHTEALSAEAHQALGKGYALGRHGL